MAYKFAKPRKPSLLSSDIKFFLLKRMFELGGVALIVLGCSLFLSLATYTPGDNSLNTVSNRATQNLLGVFGAYFSDFFIQLFGLASFFVPILLIVWGCHLALLRYVDHFKWRLFVFVLSMFCLCIGSTIIPTSYGASLIGSLGSNILSFFDPMLPLVVKILIELLIVGLGIWGYIWVLKIPKNVWVFLGKYLKRIWNWVVCKIHQAFFKDPFATVIKTEEHLVDDSLKSDQVVCENNLEKEVDHIPSLVQSTPIIPVGVTSSVSKITNISSPFAKEKSSYKAPSVDLLQDEGNQKVLPVQKQVLQEQAEKLLNVLQDFGVQGEISNVYPGPVVTLYEFKPAAGVKSSRIISLSDDIARSMSSISARISNIPGYNALGIELPNTSRQTVYMRSLLSDQSYEKTSAHLPLILGRNISGEPIIADLAKMPHLLVAGTTGSGKSVAVNAMILSLLYKRSPDECKFIMVDPKMLELSVYDDIPHLLTPVVTDPHKAVLALKWAVHEMENRYQSMSKLGVRNIEGYNQRILKAKDTKENLTRRIQTGFDPETGAPIFEDQPIELKPLPFIVVIVDEMADLMLVAGKDIEAAVQRLAQMARAAGIHLIMATQRPSVDVITGTIKANFPTRISFQVTSKIDSRTILGEQGAEQLLGQGDMLYMAAGGRISRIHGPFVRDQEVERIVQFLKSQAEPEYEASITMEETDTSGGVYGLGVNSGDSLYDQALALVLQEGKASTSFVQRHLQIGYNRAAKIVEKMEQEGVISKANHVGKREILR